MINDNVTAVTPSCDECETIAEQQYEDYKQSFQIDHDFYVEQLSDWLLDAGFKWHEDRHGCAETLAYSVGFSQGDGASFVAGLFDPDLKRSDEDLAREREIHTLRDDFPLVYLASQFLDFSVDISRMSSMYCHANTMVVNWEMDYLSDRFDMDDTVENSGTVYDGMPLNTLAELVTEDMVEEFANAYLEICRAKARELHKAMENEIMYLHSDESFANWKTWAEPDLCPECQKLSDIASDYTQMQAAFDLSPQI